MTPLKNHTLNPFISIWFSPRATFRELLNRNSFPLTLGFAIASGAISAFTMLWLLWIRLPENETLRSFWVMILWAIGGAIYGVVYLFVGSWLYKVTGRWLNGKGDVARVRLALGWSFYPSIVSGIFYLIGIVLTNILILKFIFMFLSLVIGIWGFILFLYLLSEAHLFSIFRALVAVVIGALIVIVLFAIISILLSLPTASI